MEFNHFGKIGFAVNYFLLASALFKESEPATSIQDQKSTKFITEYDGNFGTNRTDVCEKLLQLSFSDFKADMAIANNQNLNKISNQKVKVRKQK